MEEYSQYSLSTLLCGEDESCFDHFKDECFNFNFTSVSDFDSEYIRMLIRNEAIFESKYSVQNEGIRWKRRDAANWILDKEESWAMRLLSIACLSLAAKMEENEAPSLSEYDADEYSFNGDVIQRMELLVLNTLEWKMSCITPFTYLNYFASLFCSQFRLNRAVELILAIMLEINVTDHRPSVVAAAAVLAAGRDHNLTNKMLEMKIDDVPIPSWGAVEKEQTLFCYSLLQEIGMCKSNDDGMKRSGRKRRIECIDGDQDCPPPKTPKQ